MVEDGSDVAIGEDESDGMDYLLLGRLVLTTCFAGIEEDYNYDYDSDFECKPTGAHSSAADPYAG